MPSWGFDNISILDGGFDAWKREGLPVQEEVRPGEAEEEEEEEEEEEGGCPAPLRPPYPPVPFDQTSLVDRAFLKATTEDVRAHIGAGLPIMGTLPGWPDTAKSYGRSGHLPGAFNVSFYDTVDSDTGKFMPLHPDAAHLFQSRMGQAGEGGTELIAQ